MLSKNPMVKKARTAIESLYEGTFTVYVREKYKKDNGSTATREAELITDKPCRLSFSNISTTEPKTGASEIVQITKLFYAPELEIPDGSKIRVTQNGVTTDYQRSGEPAIYVTHKEIVLTIFDRWA